MNRLKWIRASYWIGAVVDAVMGVAMVYPPLLAKMLQLTEVPSSIEVRSALGMGAALMFGWTALLVWGSLQPVQRRGILLLTVVPVILGLALTTLYGYLAGYVPLIGAISVWVLQSILVTVFLSAYLMARRQDQEE